MARKMKDSGVSWVGKIPEVWEVTRGKYCLQLLNRQIKDDDGVITCFRDGEVTLRSKRREEGFTVSLKECGYQGVEPGDLVVHGMDGFAGSIGISDSRGKASPVLNVIDSNECKKYIMYYLRSMAYRDVFLALSTGIRVRSCDLRWNKLANLQYILPPLAEQKRIADYLDKTVGRIDGLREKISREIERLGDYKKSVISEVVCRGLDKKAKMKDSGIPWVGEIPAGWEVKKIASLYNVRNQKVSEKDFPALSVSKLGVVPQLSHVAKSNDTDNRKLVCAGDFAINSRSDRRGACGIAKQDGSVSLINIVLKPLENMEPGYFDWLFHSSLFADEFYKWGKGIDADVWSTHWTMMKKILVPYPPLAEQKRIAEYIDKQVARIDALVEKRKAELERLEALKRSIICECVTGKKEVAA